tara:strand:+ start:418 stop:681 length:264 start_codon:yes stop_codon:yes gene_type:complete
MKYFVYLLISFHQKKVISYVGYTNDIKKRLKLHNNSKGAKFTKGRKWILVFKKKFKTKSEAMKYEYILKFDRKKRENIKQKFIKNLS